MNRGRIQSAREASWTAATESSESPLWVGVTVSAVSFGVLSAGPAKAVTAQTPSPHSKTWRLFRRFKGERFRCAGAYRLPHFFRMKVLSIEEAQSRLAAVCQEALAGEVIRLQLENGARLELLPVPAVPPLA